MLGHPGPYWALLQQYPSWHTKSWGAGGWLGPRRAHAHPLLHAESPPCISPAEERQLEETVGWLAEVFLEEAVAWLAIGVSTKFILGPKALQRAASSLSGY
jgi:hypothetical protein